MVIFTHYRTPSLDVEDSQVTCSQIRNDGLVTPIYSPVTKPKVIRCFAAEVFDCSSLLIRMSYMLTVYKLPKVFRPHLSALRGHDTQSFLQSLALEGPDRCHPIGCLLRSSISWSLRQSYEYLVLHRTILNAPGRYLVLLAPSCFDIHGYVVRGGRESQ